MKSPRTASAPSTKPAARPEREPAQRELVGASPQAQLSGDPKEPVSLSAEALNAIARALADPKRFAILQQIAASEHLMCGQLHVQDCLSPATISHHLRELQEAGLVDSSRDGRQMRLVLRRPVWNAYLRHLQQL
ncbi:MAG: hypothetical protein NVSMB62_16710 [Acidobacteriaceae bacterium]